MTNKHAILIHPCHENNATTYSHQWAEKIKIALQEKAWEISDCATDNAIRTTVEQALAQKSSILIIFYGHGSADSLHGQDDKPVLDLQNIDKAANNTMYVMACHSALILGQAAIKSGVRHYLAYNNAVKIIFKFADDLGECVNSGLLAWLNDENLNASEIFKLIIKTYNQHIDHFVQQGGIENIKHAAVLRHNRDSLRLLGTQHYPLSQN